MAQAAPVPARVPVVVELFTSEGCSSCPPADALLTKLAKDQPVPGVQIVPIGMHVTYWDQLGWRDPASLAAATERQQNYGKVFGADNVYTPQAVVDGREQLVGGDEAALKRAIARAAKQPHAQVSLSARIEGGRIAADVTLVSDAQPGVSEPLVAWFVVTEDGLTSVVTRGENGGRTLHNDAVARSISGADIRQATLVGFHADLNGKWRLDRLRLIAILQGKTSRRIYGAATVPLT
jgi:hypothetical protein